MSEDAALRQALSEHDALKSLEKRLRDETGAPGHSCGPLGGICPFIRERGHALGVRFPDCRCPRCAS